MELLLIAGILAAVAIFLWYVTRKSRRPLKFTARISAGMLICGSALTVLAFLLLDSMCGRYEFPPVSSNDGKRFAQVSEADCGTLDDFHSSVQLWLNREGFFAHFFGKRMRTKTVFTIGDDPRLIDVAWKDDRTLVIRFPNDSRDTREYRCDSEWDGVRIECLGYKASHDKPSGEMPPRK